MINFKILIKKILLKLGYNIRPRNEIPISFSNFTNLAEGFEKYLNNTTTLQIPSNKMRIKLLTRMLGTPPTEAYHIIQSLYMTQNISGDICEFGVAQGETSALIANEIKNEPSKTFHLFDSFQGLPKPTEKDQLINDVFSLGSMEAYEGEMSFPEEMVASRLKSVSLPKTRYKIHKGFIDKVLIRNEGLPKSVSFAYIDFDFYEPIIKTLDFLNLILSKEGIIIVDDYDYFSTGAKTAVDEWLKSQNQTEKRYSLKIPDKNFGAFCVIKKI